MDWAMMGGFVALAALTAGLLRDFKRDTRREFDDSRAEFREAHAQMNQRIDDLRAETREAHKELRDDLRAESREAHAQTNKRIDDMRAETREAHAQTGRRIDDLRATVVAIVPRASAEPVDNAPAVRGNRPPEATAAAGAPKR